MWIYSDFLALKARNLLIVVHILLHHLHALQLVICESF